MLYFIYTQVQVLENLSTAGKLWYKINKAYITVSSPVSRRIDQHPASSHVFWLH